jgi:hypothetical protein
LKARFPYTVVLAAAIVLGWTTQAAAAGGPPAERTSLRTVEGTVVAVSSLRAEGDLEVVSVALHTGDADSGQLDLLLAPQQVLQEISFDLEAGDRLRARVFVEEAGPLKVHKAMNLTRGTMVRFRSLREVPLWGTSGDWEGGACRREGGHGQGGPRGRGGGGGPRR